MIKRLTILMILTLGIILGGGIDGTAVDMYGTMETGVLFNPGSATHTSTMVTGAQVLSTDTARNFRWSSFESLNYVTADSSLKVLSTGAQFEKYFKVGDFQLGIVPRTGMRGDITNKKIQYDPFIGGRFVVQIKDWFGVSLGGEQIFADDPMTNVVGGITLTPPVK